MLNALANPNEFVVGIYARQSVLKLDSCSIEMQINRGIELCNSKGWKYIVYQDPGCSGKDTNRPDFQRMLRDARSKKINMILVYKLNRISRSVKDLSDLLDELMNMGLEFKSLSESFDTTTPIGRAMVMMAGVFSQLERENTAELVRENMIDRAKMGIWNGGPVNYGFDVVKEKFQVGTKEKTLSKLVENEQEIKNVDLFFKWYMEPDGSIRNNCIKVNNPKLNIPTKQGYTWNTNQMARLLRNPIYCVADQDAYEYFSKLGVIIENAPQEFDGSCGLMWYNRRKPHGKTTRLREKDDWILAIGSHKGRIPGKVFAAIQEKLDINAADKNPRLGTSRKAKLRNVKCGLCGKAMTYSAARSENVDSLGRPVFSYYKCSTARSKGKHVCKGQSVRAAVLEDACEKQLYSLGQNKEFMEIAINKAKEELEVNVKPLQEEIKKLKTNLSELETEERNLVIALGKKTLPEHLIQARINDIAKEKNPLLERLQDLDLEINSIDLFSLDIEYVFSILKDFKNNYYSLPFDTQVTILDSLIKEVSYLDDEVKLTLNFEPPSGTHSGLSLSGPNEHLLHYRDARTSVQDKNTTKTILPGFSFSVKQELPDYTFGQKLKKARIEKGLIKKRISEMLDISESTLSSWEKDRVTPPPYSVKPIADHLGLSLIFLYGEDYFSYNNLGEEIRSKRNLLGLTQYKAALYVGCSEDAWRGWENNWHLPTKESEEKLKRTMGKFVYI